MATGTRRIEADWRTVDVIPAPAAGEIQLWRLDAVAAHASRDRILAAALGGTGSALPIRTDAFGKPDLLHAGIGFNLAHSGAVALLALAAGLALGVDVEQRRRIRRRQALLARCFGPAERDAIAAANDPEAALLRCWAAKEAVVKAIGRGIAYGLTAIELALDADGWPRLARLDGPAAAPDWQLTAFEPAPEHVAALAWRGGSRHLACYALAP